MHGYSAHDIRCGGCSNTSLRNYGLTESPPWSPRRVPPAHCWGEGPPRAPGYRSGGARYPVTSPGAPQQHTCNAQHITGNGRKLHNVPGCLTWRCLRGMESTGKTPDRAERQAAPPSRPILTRGMLDAPRRERGALGGGRLRAARAHAAPRGLRPRAAHPRAALLPAASPGCRRRRRRRCIVPRRHASGGASGGGGSAASLLRARGLRGGGVAHGVGRAGVGEDCHGNATAAVHGSRGCYRCCALAWQWAAVCSCC